MPQLQYNTESIAQASTTIGARAAQLEQEIASFFALANGLAGSSDWSGPAAEAFRAHSGDWNNRATAIREALQYIQKAVGTSGARVGEADTDNKGLFG